MLTHIWHYQFYIFCIVFVLIQLEQYVCHIVLVVNLKIVVFVLFGALIGINGISVAIALFFDYEKKKKHFVRTTEENI